jgi:hypothetical protein
MNSTSFSLAQHLQVRTKLGSRYKKYHIAFLDPRTPADIMLSGSDASSKPTSCFDKKTQKYTGSEQQLVRNAAGRPLLPCIAVQLRQKARHAKQLKDTFIS